MVTTIWTVSSPAARSGAGAAWRRVAALAAMRSGSRSTQCVLGSWLRQPVLVTRNSVGAVTSRRASTATNEVRLSVLGRSASIDQSLDALRRCTGRELHERATLA